MTQKKAENNSSVRYNSNRPGSHGPPSRIRPFRVTRIETVTMTPAEYDNAVEALAVLITAHWQHCPADPQPQRGDLELAA
jgi:hypothetical protein